MAKNRFHDGWSPVIPHLAKTTREVGDLRKDIEGALEKVADEVSESLSTVEVSGPDTLSGTATVYIKVLDSPGGDLVGQKVILSTALFLESSLDSGLPGDVANVTQIDSASLGTILHGAGSQAVSIQTDDTGECQLVLSSHGPEKIVIACRESYGGPSLNCASMHIINVS